MLRRLVALARSGITGEVSSLVDLKGFIGQEQRKFLSQVPKDYQGYYQKQVLQPKRPPRTSPVPAEKAAEEASTSGRDASPADVQLQSAQAASAWMFPWEKRQMDGAQQPLRTWEKLYWGVFVTALAGLLFSRLYRSEKPEPKVDEEKEAKKLQRARMVLAGHAFTDDDDPFEGLTPQEIQQYVLTATQGASAEDPFEGMSPEEINAYVEEHGAAAL
ncbi:g9691 [Coccomyxa elongata]